MTGARTIRGALGALALAVGATALTTIGAAAQTPASAAPTVTTTLSTQDVPGCEHGCVQRFAFDVGNGTVVQGLRSAQNLGGPSFVAVRQDGALRQVVRLSEQDPGAIGGIDDADCATREGTAWCMVTGGIGAHSESAVALTVDTAAARVTATDSVLHGTPHQHIGDLNGDGIPDVALRESTYDPAYVSGAQYWNTYLFTSSGLTRTGCSAPTTEDEPTPTTPLTGACYR